MTPDDTERTPPLPQADADRAELASEAGRDSPPPEAHRLQDEDPGPLQNEYEGEGEKDGIPANGTRPVKAQGPEDFGGNAWGEGN
ncbi:MAG TPA: hypothetical protein PLL33_04360 [Paracoccus sp. (in: a-proteobacteria)]|nr:hypothetical protein [Paracoccus sp. (in: a-proteobacteria)]